MAQSPLRYKRLIEELPKNNYIVTTSAIKAGFAESTANKQQKSLLHHAMKYQARELVEKIEQQGVVDIKDQKKLMHELIGLTREEVMNSLKKIATNERDYASALKVLTAIARELGVTIKEDEANKVVVPVLNVTVKEKPRVINGSVEPIDPTNC